MNDHDAIDAIKAVLDSHFKGAFDPFGAIQSISRIIGENAIDHMEAKESE